MTLKDRAAQFNDNFVATANEAAISAVCAIDDDLRSRNLAKDALKAGDHAPMFKLQGVDGRMFDLEIELRKGPAVISFYRGDWCPYCSLELDAWEEAMPEMVELGASIIAVSPQAFDSRQQRKLPFSSLVDLGSIVADEFGLAFEVRKKLRPAYNQLGASLPELNEGEEWVLPVPATYLVDQNGSILLAFIDPDYRNRLEPADVISALRQLRNMSKSK